MKKHRDSDRSGGDMLEGDGLRKNSSCFSNIKIFLISECALMLAQGTVGAYLVSATQPRAHAGLSRCPRREPRPCSRIGHSQACVIRVWALHWGFLLLCTRWTTVTGGRLLHSKVQPVGQISRRSAVPALL